MEIKKGAWKEFINTFFESNDMRKHLSTFNSTDFTDSKILQILNGSPVPIHTKYEWIKKLELKGGEEFSIYVKEYELAIKGLESNDGGVFCLVDRWFDCDILDDSTYFAGAYSSIDAAKGYIYKELSFDEDDECEKNDITYENGCLKGKTWTNWFELQKWKPSEENNLSYVYTYYLIEDKICYFDKINFDPKYNEWIKDRKLKTCFNTRFYIPAPFKNGDIVKLDTTPFKPANLGVIIEHENDIINNELLILVRIEDGNWMVGTVKEALIFKESYSGFMSPMYRMERYKEFMPYHILEEVSQAIRKDKRIGIKLYDKMFLSPVSEEKVREIIIEN